VLSEKWMDVAKLIAVSIVLPDEVVRFQASNPRWEPRRAFVCKKESVGVGCFWLVSWMCEMERDGVVRSWQLC
jgi:hypothetical protein